MREGAGKPMISRSLPTDGLKTTATSEEVAQLRRLEFVSVIEATTLTALIGLAVPLKHFAGWPEGVRVLGPLHGLAFLFYNWIVIQTVAGGGWRRAEILRLFGVAFIPLAGFLNFAWIRRRRAELSSCETKRGL